MKYAYAALLLTSALVTSRMVADLTTDAESSPTADRSVGSQGSPDAPLTRPHRASRFDVDTAVPSGTRHTVETADLPDAEQTTRTLAEPPVHTLLSDSESVSVTDQERRQDLPSHEQSPDSGAPGTQSIRQNSPLHEQMITPGNFEYLGAFRPPLSDAAGALFTYGGWTATYRSDGDQNGPQDGNPGSLFIQGHRQHQLIAEITIPTPVISVSKRIDDLPVASVLQPLSDVTSGLRTRLTAGSSEPFEIGGLQVEGNRLHWTLYKYYNVEGHDYLSHGASTTDFTQRHVQGLWHLGPVNSGEARWHSYKHAGYICGVPPDISSSLLGGRTMLSGLQICTGLTKSSQGPALFAYAVPDQPLRHGHPLNAVPLLWYSMNRAVAQHHYADRWTGAAWISLGDKHTVIVAGRKAHGPVHYGDPRPGDCYEDKGYHGSSYEAQVLFYAPGNLLAAARQSVADAPLWYRWDASTPGGSLDRFMFRKCARDIGGVAYDRKSNLLYIVEVDAGHCAENEWEPVPVIHTLRIVE